MPPVIYSMSVSLDGFIAGPDGDIGWTAPDAVQFRFHIEPDRSASMRRARVVRAGRRGARPSATWLTPPGGSGGSLGPATGSVEPSWTDHDERTYIRAAEADGAGGWWSRPHRSAVWVECRSPRRGCRR
jgi:hypothetical protein